MDPNHGWTVTMENCFHVDIHHSDQACTFSGRSDTPVKFAYLFSNRKIHLQSIRNPERTVVWIISFWKYYPSKNWMNPTVSFCVLYILNLNQISICITMRLKPHYIYVIRKYLAIFLSKKYHQQLWYSFPLHFPPGQRVIVFSYFFFLGLLQNFSCHWRLMKLHVGM